MVRTRKEGGAGMQVEVRGHLFRMRREKLEPQ